ncbi:hypothetical protein ABK040_008003 [Willaertia magna]
MAIPFLFIMESVLYAKMETNLQSTIYSLDESCSNRPELTICPALHYAQTKEVLSQNRTITKENFYESAKTIKGQTIQLAYIAGTLVPYLKQNQHSNPLVYIYAGNHGAGKDTVAKATCGVVNNETIIRGNCRGDCERDLGYIVFQTGLFNRSSHEEYHSYMYHQLSDYTQRNRNNDIFPVIIFDEFQYASEVQKSFIIPLINGAQFDPPIKEKNLPALSFKKTIIIINLNPHLLPVKLAVLAEANKKFDSLCDEIKDLNVEFNINNLPPQIQVAKIIQDLAFGSDLATYIASYMAGEENQRLIFDKTHLILFCKHSKASLEEIFKIRVKKCITEYKDRKKSMDEASFKQLAQRYVETIYASELKKDTLQYGSARRISEAAGHLCGELSSFFDEKCGEGVEARIVYNSNSKTIVCDTDNKNGNPVLRTAEDPAWPNLEEKARKLQGGK